MKRIALSVLLLLGMLSASATDFYVSPNGSDSNDGKSQSAAFATLSAAINAATVAGDNVYIASGTYKVNESEIMGESLPYKLVYDFSHRGKEGKPISFIGVSDADGNRPVFDFTEVAPLGYRVTAFHIKANWIYVGNIEIIGVQNGASGHSQSENVRLENASHCTLENIAAHDGMGIGFYVHRHSAYNLIVNCDAYNNYDTVGGSNKSGDGGNNDGFGCHVAASSDKGNVFIGCRAWNNTDDGFDLISCSAPVTIAYCFSAYSGYDAQNQRHGDGNGFKCGGWGMGASKVTPSAEGFPMHEIYNNVAYHNRTNGFYTNHNLGGIDFHNNTSVSNSNNNYSFVNRESPAADGNKDVNGYGHIVENNLSYRASSHGCVAWLNPDSANCKISGNNFHFINGAWKEDAIGDFQSTQYANMTLSREKFGNYNWKTMRFYQRENKSFGSDFTDYEDTIVRAKTVAGAETAGTTAIKSATFAIHAKSALYNLAGQKVSKSYKGVVIESNGVKRMIMR